MTYVTRLPALFLYRSGAIHPTSLVGLGYTYQQVELWYEPLVDRPATPPEYLPVRTRHFVLKGEIGPWAAYEEDK